MSEPATEEGLLLLDDLTNHNRRDVRLRYGWSREELAPRIAKAEQQARADAEATIQRLRERVGYLLAVSTVPEAERAYTLRVLADTTPEGER